MLKCDFCGREVERVARVVIDEGYDRLTEKHVKKYACYSCSKQKDINRTANKGSVAKKKR